MRHHLKDCLSGAAAGAAMGIALLLIMEFEGVRYAPYRDAGGVMTVCYGHTGPDIIPGKRYRPAECRALLERDWATFSRVVDRAVSVPMSDYQRAALVSFSYNVGAAAFERSTLLRQLNAGDKAGACASLRQWIYADGRPWKGLMRRREVESEVCTWGQST